VSSAAISTSADRFSGMGDERDRVISYISWLVSGLVACAVIAVTLHTDAAAATLLAGAMLIVVAVSVLMHRRVL
jgi:hypothetical protein